MSCSPKVSGGLLVQNSKATLYRQSGHTPYGQPEYRKAGSYGIQIVKMEFKESLSSIRIDSSASKSTIDEKLYDALIFMSPTAKVALADKVEIKVMDETYEFRVARIASIFTLFGGLAYYEVGLNRSGA